MPVTSLDQLVHGGEGRDAVLCVRIPASEFQSVAIAARGLGFFGGIGGLTGWALGRFAVCRVLSAAMACKAAFHQQADGQKKHHPADHSYRQNEQRHSFFLHLTPDFNKTSNFGVAFSM